MAGPESAALSRDALANIVYSRLFDWPVNKINIQIGQDPNSKVLIRVLDIYGFESFKTNRCFTDRIQLTPAQLKLAAWISIVITVQQYVYRTRELTGMPMKMYIGSTMLLHPTDAHTYSLKFSNSCVVEEGAPAAAGAGARRLPRFLIVVMYIVLLL